MKTTSFLPLFNLWLFISGQVTTRLTPQPYSLQSPSTIVNCCPFINSTNNLINCVTNLDKKWGKSVVIVTYITNSITDYASYALAINSIYSEHNNYEFKIQTAENGNNFEPIDARWNKVKILENLINLSEEREDQTKFEYIVWVDADLIVMDLGMKIQLIGEAYPEADIIMSADLEHASTLANSGYILVKNTKWSKHFLSLWWTQADRSRMSDQSALILLYQSLSQEDRSHIQVLPIDSLNTHFPAYLFQKEYNQVLHLAGETNAYRKRIFQKGFNEICSSFSFPSSSSASSPASTPSSLTQVKPIRPQLGLTKEYLANIFKQMTSVRIVELKQLQSKYTSSELFSSSSDSINPSNLSVYFKFIHNIATSALDLQKGAWEEFQSKSNEEDIASKRQFYDIEIEILKWCYDSYKNLAKVASTNVPFWKEFPHKQDVTQFEELKKMNMMIAEYYRETMSLAYNIIDFHSSHYQLVFFQPNNNPNNKSDKEKEKNEKEMNKQINLMLSILFELKKEVFPEFERRLLPDFYSRGKYYQFKLFQFITGVFHQSTEYNVLEYLSNFKSSLEVWKELHVLKYYGTNYLTVDPLKEGSRMIKQFGAVLCFELNRVKFEDKTAAMIEKEEYKNIKELTSLTAENRVLEGIKYYNEAKELMEESLESFKGNIFANNGVVIDELLTLAKLHGEMASCYSQLTGIYYQQKSFESCEKSLMYFEKIHEVDVNYQLPNELKLFKSQIEAWSKELFQFAPTSTTTTTSSSTSSTSVNSADDPQTIVVDPTQSDNTQTSSTSSSSTSSSKRFYRRKVKQTS